MTNEQKLALEIANDPYFEANQSKQLQSLVRPHTASNAYMTRSAEKIGSVSRLKINLDNADIGNYSTTLSPSKTIDRLEKFKTKYINVLKNKETELGKRYSKLKALKVKAAEHQQKYLNIKKNNNRFTEGWWLEFKLRHANVPTKRKAKENETIESKNKFEKMIFTKQGRAESNKEKILSMRSKPKNRDYDEDSDAYDVSKISRKAPLSQSAYHMKRSNLSPETLQKYNNAQVERDLSVIEQKQERALQKRIHT